MCRVDTTTKKYTKDKTYAVLEKNDNNASYRRNK